jgi:hypothetical protein
MVSPPSLIRLTSTPQLLTKMVAPNLTGGSIVWALDDLQHRFLPVWSLGDLQGRRVLRMCDCIVP